MCDAFSCVQKMVWLPILGTFNLHSDVNASECTRGSTNTLKESALKVKCGRRIFCRPWESNLRQPRARPDAEPMSAAPFQHHKFRLIIFFFVWPPFFQQTRGSFGKEVEGGSFGPVKTWMTVQPNHSRRQVPALTGSLLYEGQRASLTGLCRRRLRKR